MPGSRPAGFPRFSAIFDINRQGGFRRRVRRAPAGRSRRRGGNLSHEKLWTDVKTPCRDSWPGALRRALWDNYLKLPRRDARKPAGRFFAVFRDFWHQPAWRGPTAGLARASGPWRRARSPFVSRGAPASSAGGACRSTGNKVLSVMLRRSCKGIALSG